ncbi:IPT/TIG domain-containing protein [Lutibacter sp.]|uniref:IPT/TIG domain-containing protein n=1 Tax=Lutibacter sp. TaxID=1925666 RepID=UPI003567B0E5
MKKYNIIKNIALLTVLISTLLVACYPEQSIEYNPDVPTYDAITFTGFSPTTGYPGTPITITGTNFGDVKQAAKISFNDADVDIDTEIVSYSDTEMVVLVPEFAGTGPINLSVWTNEAQSSTDFVYKAGVVISSLSSYEATAGEQLTIFGLNFGTDASAISVLFNDGVEATIESISNTEIVVTIPTDGVSGAITITYDEGNRETVGPTFIYVDSSIVYDDFLEASEEFGGCFDRSGTQESGYWPSTQPINYIGDRKWEIHGNDQSGRSWGFVEEGSGELTIGATRSWGYDISDHAASGYTKPTTLTLEANINLGTFTNNDPPRPFRGVHLGYVSEVLNSATDGNSVSYGGLRGIIITPDSNEIYLWDGSFSTSSTTFAGIDAVSITDFIPDYDRDADHNLKLVVDTITGELVSFELDGTLIEFTDDAGNKLSPDFSDANTKYMLIGGNAISGTFAYCYDIRFY